MLVCEDISSEACWQQCLGTEAPITMLVSEDISSDACRCNAE